MNTRTPTLYLLDDPNGAAKTSFYETVFGPATALPFVNADLIAADGGPTVRRNTPRRLPDHRHL